MQKRLRVPLWSLMAAVAVASVVTLVVKPYWPGWVERYAQWQRERLVHIQLERQVVLDLPPGTGLETFLAAVQDSTRCDDLPSGVTVYVDPVALQSAGATLRSPVAVTSTRAPLRSSLRAALVQHGLDYRVNDGAIEVIGPAGP